MIRVAGAALLLLVSTGSGDDQARPPAPPPQGMILHQQIIIRVSPVQRPGTAAPAARQSIAWREERGPRCVPVRQILGAAQIGPESIDLVLRDATRIRARLERRCPAHGLLFRRLCPAQSGRHALRRPRRLPRPLGRPLRDRALPSASPARALRRLLPPRFLDNDAPRVQALARETPAAQAWRQSRTDDDLRRSRPFRRIAPRRDRGGL